MGIRTNGWSLQENTMNLKIQYGMFADMEIPERELVTTTRNDRITILWPTRARTPHFLSRFSPLDGFAVRIEATPGPLDLSVNFAPEGEPANYVNQPTHVFTATLCKDGVALATASSLCIINDRSQWEAGETNARGRLYDALGLPTEIDAALYNIDPSTIGSSTTDEGFIITPVGTRPASRNISAPDAASTPAPVDAPVPQPAAPATANASPAVAVPSVVPPRTVPAPVQTTKIDSNLLAQINVQARMRGVEVPAFKDSDEAKAFFKGLFKGSIKAQSPEEAA